MPSPHALTRQKRPSILILCEGSETEPNYLDALARERGWTSLIIPRNHKTDPLGLVRQAQTSLRRDRDLLKAYVVLDRDNHPSFEEACRLGDLLKNQDSRFGLIRSVPNFEIWLILHWEFMRAPMSKEQALARLRAIRPEYTKSNLGVIERFVDEIPAALVNADRSLKDAILTEEFNSSTEMHLLIAELEATIQID